MVEDINNLKNIVRDRIDLTRDPTDEYIKDIIDKVIKEYSNKKYISVTKRYELGDKLFNSIRRLDVLQPLLEDKTITEIMINGKDNIFIEQNGRIVKIDSSFESITKLEDVIQQVVAKVNRIVNEASPIVDARLEDGSRINIVLPPIALNGPIVTIRKFPDKPITIEQLVKWNSLTDEIAEILEKMVRAKYNIFICGGTGSGKTTFLNVLSNFIPRDERIITIEDSAELQIRSVDNLVSLETRNENVEGKGQISIRDLIKSSLRMRPDRIVVGEVRGAEALDMLQAMNTGHDGSLSTGHANSTKDMLSRLETMILTGANMPLEAIRQQIASAVDIMVHLGRLRDKSRRVLEIVEIDKYEKGNIILNPLYEFQESDNTDHDKVQGELIQTGNKLIHRNKFNMAGIDIGEEI
ncbi:type II secretion system protein E [Vallitalea longa]|uniref:Type II secretion system protein E n=1 Tax=Vallitalea longa TaxID=2936439 RepID=A0A9W5YG84_9FIRM|nr:CpaF family protein [Vallitalea longa]GKX30628.1 type II secretion system protein E [Vallitalea longa]